MTGVTMTWDVTVQVHTSRQRISKLTPRQKANQYGAQTALHEHVLRVARIRAQRQGIRGEAAEDCALEFLERMLLRADWRALRPPVEASKTTLAPNVTDDSEAWLRRCADNFAKNVRRKDGRRAQWERPWPEQPGTEGEAVSWEGPAARETPETSLLRQELAGRIQAAVGRLTPAQQDLFERHFVREETVPEMAEALGRSPHAVSQALLTLRKRLRGMLERQGLDEETARQYLSAGKPVVETGALR